jgi:hypothetical protein
MLLSPFQLSRLDIALDFVGAFGFAVTDVGGTERSQDAEEGKWSKDHNGIEEVLVRPI